MPTTQEKLQESTPPIYFAGGFGYDNERNAVVLREIGGRGYDTVPALPNPDMEVEDTGFQIVMEGVGHEVSRGRAHREAHKPEVETSISNRQQARADQLIEELEGLESPKVDAIFQSADALNGLLAVWQRPDLFDSVVLAYPAGLTKQPNVFKSAPRVIRGGIANMRASRKADPSVSFEDETSVPRKGRRKSSGGFMTADDVALSSQGKLLTEIRKSDHAPSISLVLGLQDHMFPPERVLKSLESSVDVDFILIVDTPHGMNGDRQVMDDTLGLLTKMQELREAGDSGDTSITPLTNRLILPSRISDSRRNEIIYLAGLLDAKSEAGNLPMVA